MADEPKQDPNVADGGERTDTNGTYDEAQVKAAIAEALESNEAYKGLQRAYEKSNRTYQQQLAAEKAANAALTAKTSEMAEGLDFLSNKFIRALPPEQQAAMADELRQRKITSLEKDVAQMRQALTTPAPVQQQEFDQEQMDAQMKALLREAQESLEETARDRGLDPKDKGLDYGQENQTFAARLKALNASIKKLEKDNEQKDLDGVRQKGPITATRTTGGASVGEFDGKSLWERGAEEMWQKVLEQAKTGKRK